MPDPLMTTAKVDGPSAELVERMVALVREMAASKQSSSNQSRSTEHSRWITIARAIAAELTEPVDPDETLAEELYRSAIDGSDRCPTWKHSLLNAIKRGRALAQEGK